MTSKEKRKRNRYKIIPWKYGYLPTNPCKGCGRKRDEKEILARKSTPNMVRNDFEKRFCRIFAGAISKKRSATIAEQIKKSTFGYSYPYLFCASISGVIPRMRKIRLGSIHEMKKDLSATLLV